MFSTEFFSKSKIKNNNATNAVFDFLESPENIARMIYFSERGLPALTGVVKKLEEDYADNNDFPLNNYQNRQNVGRMIKFIMGKFGYEVKDGGLAKGTRLREFAGSKYFTTSAIYEKKEDKVCHSLQITII